MRARYDWIAMTRDRDVNAKVVAGLAPLEARELYPRVGTRGKA